MENYLTILNYFAAKQVADANAAAWAAYYSQFQGGGQPPQGHNQSLPNSQGQPPNQPQPGNENFFFFNLCTSIS